MMMEMSDEFASKGSTASAATVIVEMNRGDHFGQAASSRIQEGPFIHRVNENNFSGVIPRVKRSAGLSKVGQ